MDAVWKTVGLEVYRSCRNPEKAVQSTVSLLQKYDGDGGNPGQSSSLFGILGPPSTAEAMAVSRFIGSLPADQEVFQISGSATGAALSNKRLYPNFFRVIPSDSTQIQVKRKHVRGMVIIGGHGTTQELIRRMNAEVRFVEFILSEATGLQRSTMESSSGSALGLAQGALLASPQYFGVPKFRTYWNSLWETKTVFVEQATENPWLAGFFKQKTGCTTDIGACWDGAQRDDLKLSTVDSSGEGLGLFTWYNVKATAVMAQFLKQLHEEKCAGTTGPCTRLTEAIKKRGDLLASLRGASFSLNDLGSSVSSFSDMTVQFDANGNITIPQGEAEYAVYNFRKETGGNNFVFKKIGAFDDGALNIQTPEAEFYSEDGSSLNWEALPKAQCPADRDCVECRKDLTDHVVFKEGDFYVVALIPVYSKNPTNSLECGDINGYSGADLVQAIMFAVDQVKTNVDFKGVLTGRTVGLVVINTCGTPLLVRQRILDLHSGRLTLPDGRNTSFIVPKIMGYVGAFYSSNSIAASETLTSIGRSYVEVSAVSTSPALSDRVKHPYFMRLVPPDDTQAQVFLDVVRSLGSNYIQIIYDASTAYATGLFNEVMKRVSRYDICVAQGIPITPRETSSEYKWIVDTLRDKSHAKLVIVILHELEVEKTMDAILPLLTDDNFVFLGCESWGRRQQLITGRTKLEGSLVLSLEIAVDQVFKNEFSQIDPRGGNNIWLNYFWEKRKNCYFEKSFERKDRQPCEDDIAHDYMQDTWAPFFINCVYSVVLGFNKTLSKHCSASPTFRSKCDALTSERLVEATKEVQLDLYSTGRKDKVFDSNGDGLGGFKVLQIVKDLSSSDSGQMLYKDIYRYLKKGQ
nr:hypothetical protein BaRGS_033645 [Batillaria attramentaria]